ncbi:hypothetical protein CYG49_04980 [Candidatus Saccharibacteria bacterium]|nr:MAG: hypothetical protein CYG49_04980 [Candidatus Saccharibacteria bacterium]
MNKQNGFTVIELIVVTVLLFAAGGLFWSQKSDLEAANRDAQRKTTINALYYHLEEVYFTQNKAYPQQLSRETVPGVSPDLLKGPNGSALNSTNGSIRYEPQNCNAGKCRGYVLRANLEQEADFIKQSRNS